ncbi:hypothetical protein MHB44_08845 [Lysinibacillus sp. FSL H8-0500]|uniref:hypothetical protein n=1 Tax=Lysinibacillus sp. FSL H8-0500 TaxID=2921393 RepID=UPI00310167DD
MIVIDNRHQQLQFLKWLLIVLGCKFVLVNMIPLTYCLQQFIFYGACIKIFTYCQRKTLMKYLLIGDMVLMIMYLLPMTTLTSTWYFVISMLIELLLIMELSKTVAEIEKRYYVQASTPHIMKSYQRVVLVVAASWTFLMNSDNSFVYLLILVGGILLFAVNIRLFLHIRSVRKYIKLTTHVKVS